MMRRRPEPNSPDRSSSDRKRLLTGARSFLCVLMGLLIGLLGACSTDTRSSVELGQWPIAVSPDLLGLSTDTAWLSANERTRVRVEGRTAALAAGGNVTALCRCPPMDYGMPVDATLRFGFLAFHGNGVSYYTDEAPDAGFTALQVEGLPGTVRAATCVCPGNESGDVVVLVTGGEVPPRTQGGAAEPPPWVTSGEVQLAWLRGETLVVGSPQPLVGTNPWAIRAGRFAGEDGNVMICVYTEAPFDDVVRRRPWIFRVVPGDEGEPTLDPRWRGTSFARPFRDAVFVDATGEGEGEIAALEVTEDQGRALTVYRFEGFGLEGVAPTVTLPPVEDRLQSADWSKSDSEELVVRGADGSFHFYAFDGATEAFREVRALDGPDAVLGWVITDRTAEEPGRLLCILPTGEVWRAQSSSDQ